MVQYKWIALSNTSIGVMMASVNSTIIMISLPAIFKGIGINPLTPQSFAYLLWILMGYNIVTATLLVTFGRLSDIYGRVRLFNYGFAVFTAGSILLFLTPGKGNTAAIELIVFRIIQGIGAAFLFSNSTAILTDSFPYNERGKALGINQVIGLSGSFIGLILGGILAIINWRYVFLVSVPIGAFGTAWSFLKLKETGSLKRDRIDAAGNSLFAAALTLILIAITYGLMPYGKASTGWGSPYVIASLAAGLIMLMAFIFVELHVSSPMFNLSLFKIRAFALGNLSALASAIARGGVMFMLIIFLQGIWLPLHGYSYSSVPFWAGIYMTPMTAGFLVMGPVSGALSDRMGARGLATAGMAVVAVAFVLLASLPFNFYYPEFAAIIFMMGIGNGMFAAPNTSSIMNSVQPEVRGVSSGMRSTLQNAGMTISMGIFFTIVIVTLSTRLPSTLSSALSSVGAGILIPYLTKLPPTSALFAAFLGYDPVRTMLSYLPPSLTASISPSAINAMESRTWFPYALAPALMNSLSVSFYIGAGLSVFAALLSAFRGKRYINPEAMKHAVFDEDKAESTNSQAGLPFAPGKRT
ncbi:MFS transporter [Thermoplasma sp. Kam2015]|uniref:MFS transporter n=1 Tax=Thermoplasma sp. Kam2015 TaxID=2094122 RepID=UPI000D951B87|nr:MFS transporter [Thermoplasma sp. Kam2015]PYB68081.1 MFS transporter [Thermoplasma sp. Kam2015]